MWQENKIGNLKTDENREIKNFFANSKCHNHEKLEIKETVFDNKCVFSKKVQILFV